MYHHFKGDQLSRSEQVQREVVEKILRSPLQDKDRESSRVWELKHSSSCLQIGRLLALKRNLSLEYAEIICVLHDVAVIETGKYANHAQVGSEIAGKILKDVGRFEVSEMSLIVEAILHHSEKNIYTQEPYIELVKDADVYDCSLYEGTADYYRQHKTPEVAQHYFERAKKVNKEFGIPLESFTVHFSL